MAKNKKYTPKKPTPSAQGKYAAFVAELLAGTITAVKVREVKTGPLTDLEYDEE